MTTATVGFTVRSYFCMIDSSQFDLLGHLAAPDYALHFPGVPVPLDLAGANQLIAGFQAAFPDLRHHIVQISEAAGRVEVQINGVGTQRGDFQGVPASGRSIQTPTHHTFRFEDGRIAEHWIQVDLADIMRQITAGPAGPEAHKAMALRLYEEVINGEQPAIVDEIFAADAILHDPFTGTNRGSAAFKELLGMFDTAFPHHRVRVQQVIAEGDTVAVLHTHRATHNGPFMGLPATGKSIEVNGLELFRFVDGQIVEFWRKDDDVSLLMQLGAMPAPQPA
jgi:steroid delta-isomerase-like uncharacterized protein